MRFRFGGLCAAAFLIWSASAHGAAKRIGVPKLEGSQEAIVRKAIMKVLKAHGYELVKSHEMDAAVESTGAQLDSDDGLRAIAKELALVAIVTGEVGPRRAKIIVHDGGQGSVLGEASFAGASPHKLAVEIGRVFWSKLGADVGRGRVPAGAKKAQKAAIAEGPEDSEAAPEGGSDESPASEGKTPESRVESSEGATPETANPHPRKKRPKLKMETSPEEAETEEATPSGLPWLDVGIQVGGLNRSLTYNQNQSTAAPYSLGLGPVAQATVVLYPLQPLVGGRAQNLGLETEIEQGFATSSALTGGGTFGNTVHDYAGGARYRFPFAGLSEFNVSGTGGEHAFIFTSTTTSSRANLTTIPDVIYRYLRGGMGLHLALPAGISISLSGGYRYILNKGGAQMSEFFPHLAVSGADAECGAGYALSRSIEIRAGATWRRYWYAMHSVVADRTAGVDIAGGAVDQYFAFTGGVAFTFGRGEAKSEPGAEDSPPPPPKPKAKPRRHSSDSDEREGNEDTDSGGDDSASRNSGADPND